jgi:hypothetical protein
MSVLFSARNGSACSPSLAAAPGARLCTNTSASAISSVRTSRDAGCFTSSVTDSFDRLSHTK